MIRGVMLRPRRSDSDAEMNAIRHLWPRPEAWTTCWKPAPNFCKLLSFNSETLGRLSEMLNEDRRWFMYGARCLKRGAVPWTLCQHCHSGTARLRARWAGVDRGLLRVHDENIITMRSSKGQLRHKRKSNLKGHISSISRSTLSIPNPSGALLNRKKKSNKYRKQHI